MYAVESGRSSWSLRPAIQVWSSCSPLAHPRGPGGAPRTRGGGGPARRRACSPGGSRKVRRQLAERHARQPLDAEAFVEADLDFHQAVVELAGNSVLSALFASVRPVLHEVLVEMVRNEPIPDTACAHDALVHALGEGDPTAAVAATEANLDP